MKDGGSFIRHYFNYALTAIDTFGKERRLGPTKFFRIANVSLSAFIGASVIFFLIYHNISITSFSQDLILKYIYVFLYVTAYPLGVLFLRTLTSSGASTGLIEKFLAFFPLRFVQLFMYIFTFLSPVVWLVIVFLSYIVTRSTTPHKE